MHLYLHKCHKFLFRVKFFTWNTGHFFPKKPANHELYAFWSTKMPKWSGEPNDLKVVLVEQKIISDSLLRYLHVFFSSRFDQDFIFISTVLCAVLIGWDSSKKMLFRKSICQAYLMFHTVIYLVQCVVVRVDSRLARSQWETSLQGNAVSHWLGANLESSLSGTFNFHYNIVFFVYTHNRHTTQ